MCGVGGDAHDRHSSPLGNMCSAQSSSAKPVKFEVRSAPSLGTRDFSNDPRSVLRVSGFVVEPRALGPPGAPRSMPSPTAALVPHAACAHHIPLSLQQYSERRLVLARTCFNVHRSRTLPRQASCPARQGAPGGGDRTVWPERGWQTGSGLCAWWTAAARSGCIRRAGARAACEEMCGARRGRRARRGAPGARPHVRCTSVIARHGAHAWRPGSAKARPGSVERHASRLLVPIQTRRGAARGVRHWQGALQTQRPCRARRKGVVNSASQLSGHVECVNFCSGEMVGCVWGSRSWGRPWRPGTSIRWKHSGTLALGAAA